MENISHSQTTFLQYCSTLETLFAKSAKQKNAALWLYKNDARTTLFMLESLARMYKTFHNKKRFAKMLEIFKRLEDSFGALDHYISMQAYCKQYKSIPKDISTYFTQEVENTCDALNAYLADAFFEKNINFEKIKEKITTADWMQEPEEIKAIEAYYKNQIAKINDWMTENKSFTNLEEQVHELRRKIRWLSILPQSLQGKIQLQASKENIGVYKKYTTKEITTSPFNKIPTKGKLKNSLLLNKNAYYALSWMIAELGKLKDQGLTQNALAIAYANIHLGKQLEADKATSAYVPNYQPEIKLLEQANEIVNAYFKEKILDSLLLA